MSTFEERFEYLKLRGNVGAETFGSSRFLNQDFYRSNEWRSIRNEIIIRDNGMDMGLDGYPIFGPITIHHITPLTEEDLIEHSDILLDPDQLVCVSQKTHKAIHYGFFNSIDPDPVERRMHDTIPWKE